MIELGQSLSLAALYGNDVVAKVDESKFNLQLKAFYLTQEVKNEIDKFKRKGFLEYNVSDNTYELRWIKGDDFIRFTVTAQGNEGNVQINAYKKLVGTSFIKITRENKSYSAKELVADFKHMAGPAYQVFSLFVDSEALNGL